MWKSRGLRGSALEELIVHTNEIYGKLGLLRVDKIATPIKVVEINENGTITKGFFEKKSTVDFVGIIQGMFVAYDAKETTKPSLSLGNIHPHQIEYMKAVENQGGLAFFIVHYIKFKKYILIPLRLVDSYITSGKKSISYRDIEKYLNESTLETKTDKHPRTEIFKTKKCTEIELDERKHLLCYLDALNEILS